LDFAIFLISRRSGRMKVLGRPPLYFGYRESKPSVLKLWITSRTRSALVNVTSAIFATGMPWADSRTIWARRLGTSPGHHCPGSPADDPKQPSAFVIVDLAHTYSFCHPDRVTATRRPAQHRDGASHHNRANVA
jgi:hypothetical protein